MLINKNNQTSGCCNSQHTCCNHCCNHCCQGVPGPTGPQGPQGVTGPTGPAGPAGTNSLSGIQAQLDNAADTLIETNENVRFNTIINEPGCDILYEQNTGEFILSPQKNYYVSWWVAADGTELAGAVDFAIARNNIPIAIASSPLVTCQLSGTALVTAGSEPTALSLKNVSSSHIRYAATSVQTNIIIVELTS